MVLSDPSTLYGSPTTTRAGCQSRSSASIRSQRGMPAATGTASSGVAERLTVSPQATPIRRRPKSNASTTCGAPGTTGTGIGGTGIAGSGVAPDRADARQLHPEEASRGLPAGLERQFEYQVGVHRRAQPCVSADFIFQLAAVPARISQCDDGFFRTLAAGHGGQYVPRCRYVDDVGHFERRVPFAAGAVHHETTIGLHRAAAQYLAFPQGARGNLDFQLLENLSHS